MGSPPTPGEEAQERAILNQTDTNGGSGDDGSFRTSRRLFLTTAVAGAASLQTLGLQPATAAVQRHGIEFTRVVDLVEDYGADPTGGEAVDQAVKEAAAADTLVEVPDGEYRFSGEVLISPAGNVGFVAADGASPRFVPPAGFNDHLLNFYNLPAVVFEGIDVDLGQADTTAGLRFDVENSFHVEDVEYLGRGTHPDASVTDGLNLAVADATGTGTVKNVTALAGSAIGHYKSGDGRVGIFVGRDNYGTIRIVDCHLEEFGNNGLYCSRTSGTVEVVGGTYRNNNISSVRIGGATSFVEGAEIEVDLATYDGPTTRMDSAYNTRGVWLEQRNVTKTPGATVRDCDIRIRNADNSDGAIKVWGASGETSSNVRNTRIQVDEDDVWAIAVDDSAVSVDGVSVTGTAAAGEAVLVRGAGASGSVVQNTCIEQPGSGRDGVRVKDALDCSVLDSTVDVTGEAVVSNTVVEVLNLTTDGSCPLPSFGYDVGLSTGEATDVTSSSATLGGDVTDLDGADSVDVYFEWGEAGAGLPNATSPVTLTSTGSVTADVTDLAAGTDHEFAIVAEAPDGSRNAGTTNAFRTDPLANTISLSGGSDTETVSYEFTVSGELAKGTDADDNDGVSGSTASGQVAGGVDSFSFSGEVVTFSYDGPLSVTLNGETFPASEWRNRPRSLVIEGENVDTIKTYAVEVSDSIVHDPTVGTVDPEDDVDGTAATGQVSSGTDGYRFSGDVVRFDHEGPLTVTLDGTTFPASEWMNLPNAVTFEGNTTNATATYAFEVSDEVAKDPTVGTADGDDTITGTAVEGQVTGDLDGYRYAGEIKSLSTQGPVSVTLEDNDA